MAKFVKGDRVKILENRLAPKTVGQIGTIVNIYADAETGEALYRVKLDDRKTALKGVAEECCLEKV